MGTFWWEQALLLVTCAYLTVRHIYRLDNRNPSLASAHAADSSAERQTGESVVQVCQQSRTTSQQSLMGRCKTALAGMAPTLTMHRRCACLFALHARWPNPRPSLAKWCPYALELLTCLLFHPVSPSPNPPLAPPCTSALLMSVQELEAMKARLRAMEEESKKLQEAQVWSCLGSDTQS